MFAHMLRLPAAEFEREASGLLISKIVFEVNNVTVAATRVLTTVVRDSLVIVGLLGWLLYLNWQLTLVALALIPVIAIGGRGVQQADATLNRQSLEHTGELTRVVEEAVHGYKVIKVFGALRARGRRCSGAPSNACAASRCATRWPAAPPCRSRSCARRSRWRWWCRSR